MKLTPEDIRIMNAVSGAYYIYSNVDVDCLKRLAAAGYTAWDDKFKTLRVTEAGTKALNKVK